MKNIIIFALLALTACNDNSTNEPKLSKEGLPKNCRTIVQFNIDTYKWRKYEGDAQQRMANTDAVMDSLERNCGLNGKSW